MEMSIIPIMLSSGQTKYNIAIVLLEVTKHRVYIHFFYFGLQFTFWYKAFDLGLREVQDISREAAEEARSKSDVNGSIELGNYL